MLIGPPAIAVLPSRVAWRRDDKLIRPVLQAFKAITSSGSKTRTCTLPCNRRPDFQIIPSRKKRGYMPARRTFGETATPVRVAVTSVLVVKEPYDDVSL